MSNTSGAFVASLLALALAACASSTRQSSSSAVSSVPGCASADAAVDEKRFVVIGGIEQWVTVKGDRCANPIILFISGGPGNPQLRHVA